MSPPSHVVAADCRVTFKSPSQKESRFRARKLAVLNATSIRASFAKAASAVYAFFVGEESIEAETSRREAVNLFVLADFVS